MSRKFVSLVAAAAMAAISAAPATADPVVRLSTRVSYADLDLTQVEGVKTLSLRLKVAINEVCGHPSDTASQTIARHIRACRAEALDNAVAAIDAPLLTAFLVGEQRTRIAGR